MTAPAQAQAPLEVIFRRPVEADHASVIRVIEHWFGERRARPLASLSWFRHFTGTSWIAESEGGRLLGFLIGYRSPDDVRRAVVHLVGVDPNHRRRGLGRDLVDRFVADVGATGVRTIEAVSPPDARGAIAFHRALGFRPDDGPGTMRLYGTPATPDLEGDGEDRVLLIREL
jgi:ribosomal protein S18 acetylase RimI-like enzyme